ncbi:Rho GTPase activating protein [Saxophila tyrrhenica]|uniref:Rho GTPase activating protein n=1 Tax=Saxophila tyrrhenica TaxID=1690608 RepID=A0AAV9PKZ4_9PEZI|nr:Rho GTPase activating protein [Saxophila tyrrhenica]
MSSSPREADMSGRPSDPGRRAMHGDRPLAAKNVPSTSSAPLSQTPPSRHAPGTTGAPSAAAGTAAPSHSLPVDRVRAPNPAKRVPGNPALDEIRSAVTRDAMREEAQKAASRLQSSSLRNESTPTSAAVTSPNMNPASTRPKSVVRADSQPIMPRNPSIDSTVSTVSNVSAAQKANGTTAYRVSPEPSGPQDVASVIAAAGSAEAAVQKLLNEKNQAASHNAQLWRLVEKQRSMILGLNKDLEKSLKEKDRYRRKLKEHLVQSESAPALTTATQQLEDIVGRDNSQSPVVAENVLATPQPASVRDISMDSRKVSDTSDIASLGQGRSETPQDALTAPSSVLPETPQSAGSASASIRELERLDNASTPATAATAKPPAPINVERRVVQTPPISPRLGELQRDPMNSLGVEAGHKKTISTSSGGGHSPSAPSFSSPKSLASRKAPPAPLDLGPQKKFEAINVTNNIMDASDSEYEEDPDSARAEQMARGRRKTREEDDREREVLARQEELEAIQHRSRSKKDKKSKSKSKPPAEQGGKAESGPTSRSVEHLPASTGDEPRPQVIAYDPRADPASIVRQRALTAESGALPKSATAPALLSPGLPMSPRPGDRPLNSPMPRAPNKLLNSIPMSPKSGVNGLPLSPRAPRQPIPMPPQTPLSFASPHLARAEGYQQQMMQSSSLSNQMKSTSTNSTPDTERPSTASDQMAVTPGEIYKGLVTDHYPDLLLPPNALPSIYVKTSSSRMKPSRMSYIAPRPEDNPVFTLAVHQRSDNKQLWRIEKTFVSLAYLDEQVKQISSFRDRLPERTMFSGHAPAKIDARRAALDGYFERMLDAIKDERPAIVMCRYLSTDAISANEASDYFGGATGSVDIRPDTPQTKAKPHREGYLTKRGKNFGGWKARFFVLDGPVFRYFDSQGGAQLGSIKLQNAQIGKQSNSSQNAQEDEDNQFRHAFLILEPKKKDSSALVRHVLCAESDEERDIWVDALLQYVDYREDEDEVPTRSIPAPAPRPDIAAARSPRMKPSYGEMRPPSRSREATEVQPASLRAVGYDDTIAGDAPVMGPGPGNGRKTDTPSPPHDGNFGPAVEHAAPSHPTISGPTNLHVISNTSDWGMKPPPTPQAKDHNNKKRSIFAGFRGRSSSDLGPNDKFPSPGLAPQDHYATATSGGRAVFGVPLGEAVEFARPMDVETELPAVVYRCIEYLLVKNAIAEEGIFRLSGSNTVIKGLKDRFNTEGDINLAADGKYHDVHAVASLLKLYLRELPSSILTRELHLEFLQCLEAHGRDKVVSLNYLVNRLPPANRALLDALSSFLLMIVNNAEVNKMNVRNVGIVFAPTLNVPAPLISSFVEDQAAIFGPPMDDAPTTSSHYQEATANGSAPTDLRSPRKQMFSDLPTPAYNQTTFQHSYSTPQHSTGSDDTGMIPMQPTYANYQMAPQGDGGYGSLNDALRSPNVYKTSANGGPSSRETKSKRRESGMLGWNMGGGIPKKSSMSRLREDEGASF